MMRFVWTVLYVILFVPAIAGKKKHIRFISGFYTHEIRNQRDKGHVYEISIRVIRNGVRVDSVYFDTLAVPCDVWRAPILQRIQEPCTPGYYIIKANRDFYNQQPVTSNAKQSAILPVIWVGYTYRQQRYRIKIPILHEEKPKLLR